jgi:hypothetical protein
MCAADSDDRPKTAYDRAVARFEALLTVSTSNNRLSLHRKITQAEIPKSTGYRQLEALEHTRVLSQGIARELKLSDLGWRIGLSSWGFGDVSPFASVSVRYLKTHSRRVAFLGVLMREKLCFTAYSTSRGTSFRPVAGDGVYLISSPGSSCQSTVFARDASGTSEHLVLSEVARRSSGMLVLGLMALSPEDAQRLEASGLLNDTAHRFRIGAMSPSCDDHPVNNDASR